MPGLLSQLREEHRSIAEVLGCIDHQMQIFESGNEPDFDVVLAALDYFAGFPQLCHHPKENLIYRRLCERDQGAAKELGDLLEAHDELAAHFATFDRAIREVLNEAELPRDVIVRWAHDFVDRQRCHLAMEESRFFPAAEKALTKQDWRKLSMAAPSGRDPLRADDREARFDCLHRNIVAWDREDRKSDVSDPRQR